MSLPAVEIAKLVASDAYRTDPTVINDAFETLSKVPGFIGYSRAPVLPLSLC